MNATQTTLAPTFAEADRVEKQQKRIRHHAASAILGALATIDRGMDGAKDGKYFASGFMFAAKLAGAISEGENNDALDALHEKTVKGPRWWEDAIRIR